MKIYKTTILALIISLLTSSCYEFFETSIELDIEKHESKLAVTSFISNDDTKKTVLVSYSIGGLETATDNQLLNNAIVSLSVGSTTYTLSNAIDDGIYEIDNGIIDLTEDATYTLKVEAANYKTVTSKQILPKKVDIISASLNNKNLKVRFQDEPIKRNFYTLELEQYVGNKWEIAYIYSNESNIYWSSISNNGVLFNDDTFNGNEHEITVQFDSYYNPNEEEPSLFKVKLYHVTEDYYKYDRTLSISYDSEDSPFVEPVILHRNIENGYGIFGMMNVSEFEFTVD